MGHIHELLDMTGRKVLVTGGAGHIGRAAAETFAELGADVAILDLDRTRCAEVCEALAHSSGRRGLAVQCDVEDVTSIPAALKNVLDTFGRLDVLVNCAAFVGSSDLAGWIGDFEDQTDDTFARSMAVNVTAPFALSREASVALSEAPGGGSIINVSSIYGIVGPDMRLYAGLPMGNPAGYAASKGGIQQLTRWLATVLAPSVRVNAIAPGGILRGQPQAFQDRYVDRTPLGRMATGWTAW
jgi:NAD(P)-dependent dehydrogenase (short-subunit alcohol dehydrogenase family)